MHMDAPPAKSIEVLAFQASDFVLFILLLVVLFYSLPRLLQRWLGGNRRQD